MTDVIKCESKLDGAYVITQKTPINTEAKQVYCMNCKKEIIDKYLYYNVTERHTLIIYCLPCAKKKGVMV